MRTCTTTGFPGGSDGKEFACNAEDPGSNSGLGRSPGEENGYPLQSSCLGNQTSLASYSSWGRKKLNMTKQLTHTHTHMHDKIHVIFFQALLVSRK